MRSTLVALRCWTLCAVCFVSPLHARKFPDGYKVWQIFDRLCEAIVLCERGEHAKACDLLWPRRHDLATIGGSNTQRDLFAQILERKSGQRAFGQHLRDHRLDDLRIGRRALVHVQDRSAHQLPRGQRRRARRANADRGRAGRHVCELHAGARDERRAER